MRRGLVIAGIIVAILGLLFLLASYEINVGSTSQDIPAGAALTLSPQGVGSFSLSGSWSGGNASTKVYLTNAFPTCPSPPGVVASGAGPNGSLSASLSTGTQYAVFACSGTSFQAITFSYAVSGIGYGDILGIGLLALGVIVAIVGIRARPKARATTPPVAGPNP